MQTESFVNWLFVLGFALGIGFAAESVGMGVAAFFFWPCLVMVRKVS